MSPSWLTLSTVCPTAADYNSNCPDFSQALGDGCTVSDDCSKVTCKLKFALKNITLKIQINKCEDPVTITATMSVPDHGIEWSHEYSSGDIVAVPGFTVSLPGGLLSVGVYVQVQMTDNGDQLTLKVKMYYREETVWLTVRACVRACVGLGGRGEERKRERQRQTERQRDRQRDRQRETETERQRERDREREREGGRERERRGVYLHPVNPACNSYAWEISQIWRGRSWGKRLSVPVKTQKDIDSLERRSE